MSIVLPVTVSTTATKVDIKKNFKDKIIFITTTDDVYCTFNKNQANESTPIVLTDFLDVPQGGSPSVTKLDNGQFQFDDVTVTNVVKGQTAFWLDSSGNQKATIKITEVGTDYIIGSLIDPEQIPETLASTDVLKIWPDDNVSEFIEPINADGVESIAFKTISGVGTVKIRAFDTLQKAREYIQFGISGGSSGGSCAPAPINVSSGGAISAAEDISVDLDYIYSFGGYIENDSGSAGNISVKAYATIGDTEDDITADFLTADPVILAPGDVEKINEQPGSNILTCYNSLRLELTPVTTATHKTRLYLGMRY